MTPNPSIENGSRRTHNFSYRYNLGDALLSEAYPSGRAVGCSEMRWDRTMQVLGVRQPVGSYVAGLSQATHHQQPAFTYGNNLTRLLVYNVRPLPAEK